MTLEDADSANRIKTKCPISTISELYIKFSPGKTVTLSGTENSVRQRILGRDGKTPSREGERGKEVGGEGGGGKGLERSSLYSHFCTNPQPQNNQTKIDISKQHSKQDKKGEIERSYKMFAN